MKKYTKNIVNGFTIIELIVTVTVIGILATITIVSYHGVQERARDTSVLSDLDSLDGLETSYIQKHGSAIAYYSGTDGAASAELGFKPSSGNVIDLVVSGDEYCIRGYNTKGTKNSIYNPSKKESSSGMCDQIAASAQAIADSGGSVPLGWVSVGVGMSHTCAVSLDYKVYCWGGNASGQLGNGSTTTSLLPVAVDTSALPGNKTVKKLYVFDTYNCVIASDDKAYCWGDNFQGQIGSGSADNSILAPAAVDTTGVLSGLTIKSMIGPSPDAGNMYVCVIASDNKLYCWGGNQYGQLGDGTNVTRRSPVAVDTTGVLSGKTINKISTGEDYVCVIASDSKLYCWGNNQNGQLGDGTSNTSYSPVAVNTSSAGVDTFNDVSARKFHTCAVASNNKAYCWGWDGIGNGTAWAGMPDAVDTTGVLSGLTIKSIEAGEWFTCAIASDDKAYCWGANGSGQIGDGSTNYALTPAAVRTDGVLNNLTIRSIYTGIDNTCVIASNNKTYCWGNNAYGQLGDSSTTTSAVPVAVRSDGDLNGLSVNSMVLDSRMYLESVVIAIASDNNLYCWGGNDNGTASGVGGEKFGYNSSAGTLVPKKCGLR